MLLGVPEGSTPAGLDPLNDPPPRQTKQRAQRPRINSELSGTTTIPRTSSRDSKCLIRAFSMDVESPTSQRTGSLQQIQPPRSSGRSTSQNTTSNLGGSHTSPGSDDLSYGSSDYTGSAEISRNSTPPPTDDSLLQVPNLDEVRDSLLRRVRSFRTTSKGLVVNRGDSFKKKSTNSLMSTGNTITDSRPQQPCAPASQQFNSDSGISDQCRSPTFYRVLMLGASGCGKTLMARQFMTSDYVGGHEDHHELHENTVAVLLDGEESIIHFIDPPDKNVDIDGLQTLPDAYVVVFAINDQTSFLRAQEMVRYLRVDHGTDKVIVLVANKIDLVRKRKVSADEARFVAETFDCKYTETSAALNHSLDELLVGILTQIRLHMRIPFTTISFPGKEHSMEDGKNDRRSDGGPAGFLRRLFRRSERKKLKPCENLYIL